MANLSWRVTAPGTTPRTFRWAEAAEKIREAAWPAGERADVVVIGITGPVGSGKSTLARAISECVISTDWYLPDYDLVEERFRDRPELADLDLLAKNLADLRSGNPTRAPVWSYTTHARAGAREVVPAPIVVCEGIHALHAIPRPHLDLRVFVEAPRDVRWGRWEAMERDGQKGWTVEVAREHFEKIAEPTWEMFEAEYRRHAEIVVINDGTATSRA